MASTLAIAALFVPLGCRHPVVHGPSLPKLVDGAFSEARSSLTLTSGWIRLFEDPMSPHPDLAVRFEALYDHFPLRLVLPEVSEDVFLIRIMCSIRSHPALTGVLLFLPTPDSVQGSRGGVAD